MPSRHLSDTPQTPSDKRWDCQKLLNMYGHSFWQKLGEGYSFLLSSFFLLVTGENNVNYDSVQLKFSWVCKLEWSLTKGWYSKDNVM